MHNKKKMYLFYILSLLLFTLVLLENIEALPLGPVNITTVANETGPTTSGYMLNTSGGQITTVIINGTTQNMRWKAYVGNVTGKLALQDATGSTIYDWTLTATIAGEIYASRSSSVSWADINCTWAGTGNKNSVNRTVEEQENYIINHTNPDDNISKTFNTINHSSFYVGNIRIPMNTCYSAHTYKNSSAQSGDFEEILLYDNSTSAYNGHVVYSTILENDMSGFDNFYYDFQMIVPENGAVGWTSSTAYYFFVELI